MQVQGSNPAYKYNLGFFSGEFQQFSGPWLTLKSCVLKQRGNRSKNIIPDSEKPCYIKSNETDQHICLTKKTKTHRHSDDYSLKKGNKKSSFTMLNFIFFFLILH